MRKFIMQNNLRIDLLRKAYRSTEESVIMVTNTCTLPGSVGVSLLSTMDFQPDSRRKYLLKVSLKWMKRFKMREQRIKHTEWTRIGKYSTCICHGHGGSQLLEFS